MTDREQPIPWWVVHQSRGLHLLQVTFWTYLTARFLWDAVEEGGAMWLPAGGTLLLATFSAAALVYLTRRPSARAGLFDLLAGRKADSPATTTDTSEPDLGRAESPPAGRGQ